MKVFAQFDANGNIRSLVGYQAPEGFTLGLAPTPGALMAEVDGLKLESKNTESDIETLSEIARTHRVTTPVQRCTLKKASAK